MGFSAEGPTWRASERIWPRKAAVESLRRLGGALSGSWSMDLQQESVPLLS